MHSARIIPCLLLSNGRLVKSIKFNNPTYIGDPLNAVKIFNEKEVDEIVIFDIHPRRNIVGPDFDTIAQIASEAFMPLCYGGGISNLEQAQKLVKIGVEKVAINSAALKDKHLVTILAEALGSQSVVVGIDVKRDWVGRYRVFNPTSHKLTHIDPFEYAGELVKAGAGEIFLNNVDADGTLSGYDIKLITQVSKSVNVPVIVCGGASSLNDLRAGVQAGASGVAAGSLFVFQGKHRAVLISYPTSLELSKITENSNS